ncbi:MAG TPA: hypothetical protein VNS32_15780 [Flavisolibacter sp.]|nr:hypothetical protein [Flavisolibacter sp.]
MSKLSPNDIQLILESLKYTKLKFESMPIGESGYPSYEFKRNKIDEVDVLIQKLRKIFTNPE